MSFFILLALGRLLDYLKIFPAGTDKSLNLYVIYIALPALILSQVPGLDFSGDILTPLVMPWLVVLVSGLTVLLLCRMLRWPRETTGALLLMVPLGNTAFLGMPMVERFFGPDALPYAVLYDQLSSFLILSSYGTIFLPSTAAVPSLPFSPCSGKLLPFHPLSRCLPLFCCGELFRPIGCRICWP